MFFLAVCQAQIAVMYRAYALIHGSRTCEPRGKACPRTRFQIMNLKYDPELLHQTGNSSICEMKYWKASIWDNKLQCYHVSYFEIFPNTHLRLCWKLTYTQRKEADLLSRDQGLTINCHKMTMNQWDRKCNTSSNLRKKNNSASLSSLLHLCQLPSTYCL